MGIVLGGILSYLVAFIIDFYHISLMTKDFVDKGYKIKYKEYLHNLDEKNLNWKYVPYLTLIPAFTSLYRYFNNRDNIIRKAIFNGSVEPLNDKEQEAYNKKKTFSKAFKINMDNVMHGRMAHDLAKQFNIPDDEVFVVKKEFKIDPKNVIYYQVDMLNDNAFKVTSARGELINKLSREEQLQIIYDYYDLLNEKIDEYVKKYYQGDKKKFEDDVFNNKVDMEQVKEELKTEYIQDAVIKKLK